MLLLEKKKPQDTAYCLGGIFVKITSAKGALANFARYMLIVPSIPFPFLHPSLPLQASTG
jgi:hypothetical protein